MLHFSHGIYEAVHKLAFGHKYKKQRDEESKLIKHCSNPNKCITMKYSVGIGENVL